MRLLTTLRRLNESQKDRFVLITSVTLTVCIAVSGFLYTYTSNKKDTLTAKTAVSTSTVGSLFQEIQTTIVPTFSEIKENINTLSEEYKERNNTDVFVPKPD